MLVLSRHASETIRIGDNIVVSIQRISGNRVIIGIDAPPEVAIRRGELAFEGDSNAPVEGSKAVSKLAVANSTGAKSKAPTRSPDRGPIIVPMGERAADWSASHVS